MTVSQVPDTSTTLLRDVADSSHARWSVFYARYQPMMRSYLQSRFPSLDADDIIQETFVALAKINEQTNDCGSNVRICAAAFQAASELRQKMDELKGAQKELGKAWSDMKCEVRMSENVRDELDMV